ncbi:MAG: low temperature requirement protein A [Candidatus Heimdallarchaeota archaeon]|nr:low temperature requirement protein A [Candidatus Heimdallarchaeota archaeon]
MTKASGTFRDWWQYPRKYGIDPGHRQVSFLELFYDLVYVVVIAELGHTLSKHISLQGFLEFAFLFVMVWWAWFNGSAYHDFHGNNDIRTRVFTFLQMGTVVSMAVFAHNALDEGAQGFFLSYAAFHLILTYLWWRTGVHDPDHRQASNPYSFIFLVVTILFVISAFVEEPINQYLWFSAIILGMGLPVFLVPTMRRMRAEIERTQLISNAGVERFGLFTIIVLGEVIVGVVQGVAEVENLDINVGITAVLGLLIAIGIWWLYFDLVSNRLPIENLGKAYSWIYLHLPLSMSITAIGAVMLNIVEDSDEKLAPGVVWLLSCAVVTILFTIILLIQVIQVPAIYKTLYRAMSLPILFSITGIGISGFLIGQSVDPIAFLLTIVFFLMLPILYALRLWIRVIRTGQTISLQN